MLQDSSTEAPQFSSQDESSTASEGGTVFTPEEEEIREGKNQSSSRSKNSRSRSKKPASPPTVPPGDSLSVQLQSRLNEAGDAVNGVTQQVLDAADEQSSALAQLLKLYPFIVVTKALEQLPQDGLGKSFSLNLSPPPSQIPTLLAEYQVLDIEIAGALEAPS